MSHQRNEQWAATDTSGEFRLRFPQDRTTVFEVKSIGYEPIVFAVDGKRYRAAVVEIGLASAGFHVAYGGISVLATRGLTACNP
jgi:hypothetical protein